MAMESPLPRVDWADPRHLEILAKAVSPEGPGLPGEVFRHETCETARETWVRVQHIKNMFHPNELLLDLIQQERLVGYCGVFFLISLDFFRSPWENGIAMWLFLLPNP